MSRSILIVEDERVLRDIYKEVLSSQGFTIVTATNGEEALEELKVGMPDLILLDLFMPVMGGLEFLNRIKLLDYPDIKIIVCTNLPEHSTESEVIKLGAMKLVVKANMGPGDLIDLANTYTTATA